MKCTWRAPAASHPRRARRVRLLTRRRSDLTGEELWGMTQLGYIPLKLLISTIRVLAGSDRRHQGGVPEFREGRDPRFDHPDLRRGAKQVFDRLKREAAALGAEDVVGIKTYIIELGTSLVEIFSVGTAVRKLTGVAVQTASLPARSHHSRQGYLATTVFGRLRPAVDARRRRDFGVPYGAPNVQELDSQDDP